jgi:hypothetical protein
MSIALSQHDTNMAYNINNNTSFHLSLLQLQQQQLLQHQQQQQQQQQQHIDKDRRVLYLNNRACVLVLSKGDYSEANKLFDSALMIHREEAEEYSMDQDSYAVETAASLPSVPSLSHSNSNGNSNSNSNHDCYEDNFDHSHCDLDFSESADDLSEYDDEFGDMDWDGKDDIHNDRCCNTSIDSQLELHQYQHQHQHQQHQLNDSHNISSSKILHESPVVPSRNKIPRMTSYSRLRTISYCGQQEYQEDTHQQFNGAHNHQVYNLPIVMDETEWDTAPIQDKSFVLIFNTAVCNHLWGMQLMQQYITATTTGTPTVPSAAAIAEHCRETLTVAKLLYKLALKNSVSFANGVDKMCYVALYNNLSHVCKTLEGYDSTEAQWCDDMLLKAIFWWRDSHQQQQPSNPSSSSNSNNNNNNNSFQRNNTTNMFATTTATTYAPSSTTAAVFTSHHPTTDRYLDDDYEIIDAFFDNVYYRVGVPEDIVPAAAA